MVVDARVGRDYRGSSGDQYFDYQLAASAAVAPLETWKFENHIAPTDTVVDFGCGSGAILECLGAAQKLGIEVNVAAREEASRRGIETLESADEVPRQFADVVISNHALEHTVRPIDELEALRDILKPTGRLVLCVPFDDWRKNRRFRVTQCEPDHHLYTWSPLLLRNLLEEAGYDVMESRLLHFTWPPFTLVCSKFPRPIFHAAGRLASVLRHSQQVIAVARPATDRGSCGGMVEGLK